ncbi:hypothetical protein CNEO3_660012 [Clostridium neonatale]|uniref:Uncharacterized protein n=1 Tax=Clostridium neonatale TaxID=137838 RepID=A0AA86MHI3_9CLOT|nr:hypothetical protein CNEO_44440 [Clostridium neonatale]CAI3567942.1 hypothetical protein CNEO3_130012 [Clostridium neonatale]CAI3582784.1 hypothetical protein CNEO3_140012 [Clostridium neonatale]CAI3602762.1 hypothetical protein CNEO3_180012 [Clostridium neonatale]CAI3607320.1 hypothetical protein CNEO4_350013 [Clostridium neonatale]
MVNYDTYAIPMLLNFQKTLYYLARGHTYYISILQCFKQKNIANLFLIMNSALF